MKITAITSQQEDKNRVNVLVDGVYRLSLDVYQYADLGVRVGKEYSEAELVALEAESQFGKVYGRTLEYCLMRPHSAKEVRDYLYRKTRDTRTKMGGVKKGISPETADGVFARLIEKGHIDDEKFARYWLENRNARKGASQRKLQAELRAKGLEPALIERLLAESTRDDPTELEKVIAKKRSRYSDDQKLMHYLARQGFGYEDIKTALAGEEN